MNVEARESGTNTGSKVTQRRIYRRSKEAGKELKELVASTGTTLMDLHGIGPSGAARLLVEAGDITRFPNRAHFASWNGTAPIDASSGEQVRHRLSRAGNRQINRVLHTMATVQRRHTAARIGTLIAQRPASESGHHPPGRQMVMMVFRLL